jgi:hypothetical protein
VPAKGTEAGITLCLQYNAYAYDNPRGGLWNMADFTLRVQKSQNKSNK